jgi:hypothetical protein
MRRVLKKIANDEADLGDVSTLAEPAVIQVTSDIHFVPIQLVFGPQPIR